MPLSHKNYRSHLYENRTHPEEAAVPSKNSLSLSFWIFSGVPFLLVEYFLEVEFKRLPSGLAFPAGFVIFWGFYHTLLLSKFKMPQKIVLKKTPPPLRSVKSPPRSEHPPKQAPAKKEEDFLPEKVLQNLSVLGLKPTRDWNTIHKRYRELAKQYHPDLNPEVTTRGTRFMIYDAAYRNLVKFKKEYFK